MIDMIVNAVLYYKYIYFIYIYYFLNHGQQEQLNLIFDTLSEVSNKLRELSIILKIVLLSILSV